MSHTFLGISLGLTILSIIHVFIKKNTQLKEKHKDTLSELQQQYDTHNNHINTRHMTLDRYHFTKYNLDESLIVQPKISC